MQTTPTSSDTFRETTITVAGVAHVVRTERTGTVKQLEAAHMKACRATIDDARQAKLDAQYADMVTDAEKPRKDTEGFPGSGERQRGRLLAEAAAWRVKYGTVTAVKPLKSNYVDARKGFPKVSSTASIPEYLVRVAPDHYASPEAADSMGASERIDEVIPGLAPARSGKGWILRHTPSVTEEKPNAHIGPVFKTLKRAREVALTELSRFDFTRSQAEIVADPETAAHVQFVKWREFVSASTRNAWAEVRLREAEAAIAALNLANVA